MSSTGTSAEMESWWEAASGWGQGRVKTAGLGKTAKGWRASYWGDESVLKRTAVTDVRLWEYTRKSLTVYFQSWTVCYVNYNKAIIGKKTVREVRRSCFPIFPHCLHPNVNSPVRHLGNYHWRKVSACHGVTRRFMWPQHSQDSELSCAIPLRSHHPSPTIPPRVHWFVLYLYNFGILRLLYR